MQEFDHPIAVMDATCALCSWGARMIHRLDRTGQIRIAPIQSATGAALMRRHGLDPLDPDSWLFIEDGVMWRAFDAVLRLGLRAGGLGRLCGILYVLPRPVRDWLYARIARNRYALFGHADMCALPDPTFRARLMS